MNLSLHFTNTGEVREVPVREVYAVSLQYKVGNFSRWHPLTLKFSTLQENHLTSSFTGSRHLEQSALSSKILETSKTLSVFFLWSDQTETCLVLPIWLKYPLLFHRFLRTPTLRDFCLHQNHLSQHQSQAPGFLDCARKPTNISQHYPERSKPKNK